MKRQRTQYMPKSAARTQYDLRASREERGISQIDAADLLCTTQPSIARWESSGHMSPTAHRLWVLHWEMHDQKAKRRGARKKSKSKAALPATDLDPEEYHQ